MLILPDGVRQERLISDEYRAQQRAMHANPEYGVASQAFAPVVAKVMNQYAVVELLDYGAGKGRLAQTLMRDRLVDHPFRDTCESLMNALIAEAVAKEGLA